MMIAIRHKSTGEVLHQVEAESLEGADLSGLSLFGVDLAGAVLTGAKFDRSSLIGALFATIQLDPAVELEATGTAPQGREIEGRVRGPERVGGHRRLRRGPLHGCAAVQRGTGRELCRGVPGQGCGFSHGAYSH